MPFMGRSRFALPLGLGLLFGFGCQGPSAFRCVEDDQCGPEGACEPDGFCSFPDVACESGQRYGEHAGSRSGECIPTTETSGSADDAGTTQAAGTAGADADSVGDDLDGGSADATSSDPTTSSTTSGSEAGDSTSSATDSTSTTDATTTSGHGASSSTGGAPPTCDELFGSLSGYQSCTETESACTFYVVSDGVSCDTLCGEAGRECLGAWGDDGACALGDEHGCSATGSADQHCQCELEPDSTLPSCDSVYGDLPGYVECSRDANTCRFEVQSNDQTCAQVCASRDRACIDSWDDGANACELSGQSTNCSAAFNEQICECPRG